MYHEHWSTYYSIPFLCTSASKLRSFQYRIFHRTIGTNVLLMKMGNKDHDDCFFFATVNLKPESTSFGTATGYSPSGAPSQIGLG